MSAYYNEHDLKAAAWLDMLSTCGEITTGDVDPRDIQKVRIDDLRAYDRCHFFAGIGGWDYALRLAGWPADAPVWTASLPCQPFSSAGKQRGTEDERHLWPVFRDLVEQCRPAILFGEQVASKPGRAWLASVQTDLEALGYITAAADLCAAGVGAPHIRQRLYWCAVRREGEFEGREATEAMGHGGTVESAGGAGGVGHSERIGAGRLARGGIEAKRETCLRAECDVTRASGLWGDVVYVPCADGKARPLPRATKPSPEQMAPSFSPLVVRGGDQSTQIDAEASAEGRVTRLRGYGNAINIGVAVVFIRSVLDALQEQKG